MRTEHAGMQVDYEEMRTAWARLLAAVHGPPPLPGHALPRRVPGGSHLPPTRLGNHSGERDQAAGQRCDNPGMGTGPG
jgi:hypothetical protein